MPSARERLKKIADQINNGVVPPSVTVREFLWWFGAERRGYNVVWNIRQTLAQVGVKTNPDFDYEYIDAGITFVAAGTESQTADLTYRIGTLESANRKPISVKPDDSLEKATTLMLFHEFSQLPVMPNERDVKGVVSWKSIGSRLALGSKFDFVRQCLDSPQVIQADASLFSAIDIIAEHDFVLIRGPDQTISGIVTASDLAQQFRQLAEPFLLIGEIENHVRRLIRGKFTVEELSKVKDDEDEGRSIDRVEDLTFGEYIRLFENSARWKKLNLPIDRRVFVKRLDEVRKIRNDVAHFDPDGLSEGNLKTLRDFSRFMQDLSKMGIM